MTLDQIGLKHGTDKSSACHDYLHIYERYFKRFKMYDAVVSELKLLEIGIAGGASLRTWSDYFTDFNGSQGRIFGVDHNIESVKDYGPQITTFHGEATDRDFWPKVIQTAGVFFDVIIDDASHHSSGIIDTFDNVWPLVRPGGLYCCEDLHCSYDAAYNRTKDYPRAVDFFRSLVDHVMEYGANNCGKPGSSRFEFIHFYKSLVIIKKR